MALFGKAPRQIFARLLAPEADFENFTSRQPVEPQTRANEGHRASVCRDIDQVRYWRILHLDDLPHIILGVVQQGGMVESNSCCIPN